MLAASAEQQGDSENALQTAYLAGYIETFCRQKIRLTVQSLDPVSVFCNGSLKGKKTTRSKDGNPAETSVNLDLVMGKHCIIIKTVRLADSSSDEWFVRVKAAPTTTGVKGPQWSIEPTRTLSKVTELTSLESVGGLALSPGGNLLAVQRSAYSGKKPARSTWIEILDISSGKKNIEQVLRIGRSSHSPLWSPGGACLAFRSDGTVWTYDPNTQEIEKALEDVKGLGSFFWSCDSRSLYFMTSADKPAGKDYQRLWDPRDRLTDWDESVKLHVAAINGSSRQLLTETGKFALTQAALSPDGRKIAMVRRVPIAERPFFESEFWVMELAPRKLTLIKKTRFPFENGPAHLTWSPDSGKIAFTAPPGETVPSGQGEEHNAFDTCLWVLDIATKKLDRVSDRFGESVASGLWWRKQDGKIYFLAQKRALQCIARIDPYGTGGIEVLTDSPSVVSSFSPAAGGKSIAYAGSSIDRPVRVLVMDIDSGSSSLVLDPNEKLMKNIELGRYERFDFENRDGDLLDGWILYPPSFDETVKHPMIVYYYGGVSPRQKRFTLLYYHWLAANGYVIYVVNPSGAVGQGHQFADKHCNDQGELACRDIIDGTTRVLEAKPFIDRSRIGCYGGSYGGFLTMCLITKTDIFSAACSMYGISNISSYWGAGIWGYTYGDTAIAGSYPWTRPDIFVNRSPLYNADKVETPLLLLHGDADVNVPPSESEQMFTALKVLDKDVAYVRFAGEGHGISGKTSNLIAHRSMILEWFDKHLKDRPEGWEQRWKE